MRRSPGPPQRPSIGGPDGPSATAASVSVPPETPRHHKSGAALNELVTSLEQEFKLQLNVRNAQWSPRKSEKTKADRIYGHIQFLYYKKRDILDASLNQFRDMRTKIPYDSHLDLLDGLLKPGVEKTKSRTVTPLGEVPKVFKPSPLCKSPTFARMWNSQTRG